MTPTGRSRWLALYVLALGDIMIVLDGTIVNVALPSIRDDLGFSQTSLAWVVNAYLLTFGGFLLLGGRLGDLYGHRRLFLIGIGIFTGASLACGLATSQGFLISVVVLSLVMIMFTEPAERAKAMGIIGFVLSGGGTAGVLLGGILTDLLSWHWIFLVNIPVGITVFILSIYLCPSVRVPGAERRLDIGGAITVTGALMLAVYAIVQGNEEGWTSAQTLGFLGAAAALIGVFIAIEARHPAPLMPLGLFRHRNISVANIVAVLMAAAMFAMFFFSALYLQLVLGYSPLEVGLAFLPATLVWGASSLFLSDRLIMRFGIKAPIVGGLAFFIAGLLLFARAPVDGDFVMDVLVPMLCFGVGGGITFNPLLLAAMGDVEPQDSGLASGIVNTSFMMGGALGLAVLAAIATSRTDNLLASGENATEALLSGYHYAFFTGAIFAIIAAAGALLLHAKLPSHAPESAMAPEADPSGA
jgi:EmrB/QacA subfamily drug resistance transporter